MSKLIAFTGSKGAGKDCAAQVFTQRGYANVKFAAPMKMMLRILLIYRGADPTNIGRMLEGDLKEVPTEFLDGRSPRHALQTIGTEWGRNLMHQDFWINAFKDRVESSTTPVVVTDCRFHNEVQAIRDLGGEVWRITGRGATNDPHPSEAEIPHLKVDGEIVNDCPSAATFRDVVERMFFTAP